VIDFRYHLVSIVAIFIALAVGIVLGSGPLKDDISGFLEDRTNQLAHQKVDLQNQLADLRDVQDSSDQYAALVQPRVVQGLLIGHSVVTIELPGAKDDAVKAVEEAVGQAGGQVTERVQVQDAWTDPKQTDVLGRVSEGLTRTTGQDDPYEMAGEVLATALVTNNDRLAGEPYSPSIGVLAAYEEAGFIKASGGEVIRGSTAIVIGSDTVDETASNTLLPLISWLDSSGEGTVVSGPPPSAEQGGIVAAVRHSDLVKQVSTDDRVDSAEGVSVTILALVDQTQGVTGQYGTGPDSQGPAPDPIPGI